MFFDFASACMHRLKLKVSGQSLDNKASKIGHQSQEKSTNVMNLKI